MRIQHNIAAMNSYRNYTANTSSVNKNLEKLSSGYKINRAGDDAAGLAISEKMRAQITGLERAQANAKDGVSLVQTAEGALTEVHDMLNRMYDLAEQSANGTYDNSVDRANLQAEVTALTTEINRIADASNFNGINLLDGSLDSGRAAVAAEAATAAVYKSADQTVLAADGKFTIGGFTSTADIDVSEDATLEAQLNTFVTDYNTNAADKGKWTASVTADKKGITFTAKEAGAVAAGPAGTTVVTAGKDAKPAVEAGNALTLQIGDTADAFNKMSVNIKDMHADALGIGSIDITSQTSAATAMSAIKNAINSVSTTRGDLGAIQNRLEHTMSNLSVMTENIQDAESSIRDVDVAEEMMAYTKNNILVQSAQAMLAQANQAPQGVLQLLQ